MNMYYFFGAILILLLFWSHTSLYRYGKRMMLELIRSHIQGGADPEAALLYEEDILEGKVPRG